MSIISAMLLSSTLLVAGCIAIPIPNDRPLSPLFHGQVRDAISGRPVSKATVRVGAVGVNPSRVQTPLTVISQTDEQGFFSVAVMEPSNWVIVIIETAGSCSGVLTVTHPEYEEQSFEFSGFRDALLLNTSLCGGVKVKRDVLLQRK